METETIKTEVEEIFARYELSDQLQGDLVVNCPLTGETIASVRSDTIESLDAIIGNSHTAQISWKGVETDVRGKFLEVLAKKITECAFDLCKLIHYISGKSIRESAAEVNSVVGLANATVRDAGYEPLSSGAQRSKEFTPLGVIAIVSPFNFPLAISLWTGLPALLAGNSVVNKPSEKTALVSILFEAVFKKAVEEFNGYLGENLIPANIFQVANGGPAVGKLLVDDKRVAKVVFTGGIDSCESIKAADDAVRRRAKALTEGGAANFAILSDKHDGMTQREYAGFVVGAIMKSFLPYAGQKCINTRQLFVHEKVVDAVVQEFEIRFNAFESTWRTENAFYEDNPLEYTALIDQRAGERFEWALQQAREQGARVVGGKRWACEGYSNAQYFMPAIAIFQGLAPLMNEEIFGPFLMIVPYASGVEEALAMARKPNANLVNAYYGSDVQEAQVFKLKNTAGFSLINPPLGTGLLPLYGLGFGGNQLSGQGESLSRDPLLAFVQPEGAIRRNVMFEFPVSN